MFETSGWEGEGCSGEGEGALGRVKGCSKEGEGALGRVRGALGRVRML